MVGHWLLRLHCNAHLLVVDPAGDILYVSLADVGLPKLIDSLFARLLDSLLVLLLHLGGVEAL